MYDAFRVNMCKGAEALVDYDCAGIVILLYFIVIYGKGTRSGLFVFATLSRIRIAHLQASISVAKRSSGVAKV